MKYHITIKDEVGSIHGFKVEAGNLQAASDKAMEKAVSLMPNDEDLVVIASEIE